MEKRAKIVYGISDGLGKVPVDVLVLVSTYNGEKYLREQIDSLISQIGVQVNILIRDDGSSDGTVDILEEYSKKHLNFSYYVGENRGVIKSFNDLMLRSELDQYKYVAFCDQDDVWDNDKLLIALNEMDEQEDIPIMYCSNLKLVDSKLNEIRPMRDPVREYTAHMSVVQNIGTGCTQVFNHRAVELYRMGIGNRMEMHDYWMTLLCMFLGKIIYDNNPHIRYRQHSNNVVGAKDKQLTKAVKHLQSTGGNRAAMLQDFLNCYDVGRYGKIIEPVVGDALSDRVRLVFSLKYKGIMKSVTTGFKIRALTGRMY